MSGTWLDVAVNPVALENTDIDISPAYDAVPSIPTVTNTDQAAVNSLPLSIIYNANDRATYIVSSVPAGANTAYAAPIGTLLYSSLTNYVEKDVGYYAGSSTATILSQGTYYYLEGNVVAQLSRTIGRGTGQLTTTRLPSDSAGWSFASRKRASGEESRTRD